MTRPDFHEAIVNDIMAMCDSVQIVERVSEMEEITGKFFDYGPIDDLFRQIRSKLTLIEAANVCDALDIPVDGITPAEKLAGELRNRNNPKP